MEQCSGGGWPRHSWQRRQVHCSDRGEWESLRRHASRRLRLRFVAVEAALLLFTWQPSELFWELSGAREPSLLHPRSWHPGLQNSPPLGLETALQARAHSGNRAETTLKQ